MIKMSCGRDIKITWHIKVHTSGGAEDSFLTMFHRFGAHSRRSTSSSERFFPTSSWDTNVK